MKLNKRLNFVIPIYRDDGAAIDGYVYGAPIGEDTFDKYCITIGKAFTQIYNGGIGLYAGPRIAAKIIRKIAREDGDIEDVEAGLFAEIKRLANFIRPGHGPVPVEDAIREKLLSEEDASEVENALAFFTVASSMHRKNELPVILEVVSKIWDARTSSSNLTEFANSLKTSIATESSGVKAKPSPIAV